MGVESRSVRINQSQCSFPLFVIGLVLLLLLASSKTQFLQHRKPRSRNRNHIYHNVVFVNFKFSALITTPTPSLVKTSLKRPPLIIVTSDKRPRPLFTLTVNSFPLSDHQTHGVVSLFAVFTTPIIVDEFSVTTWNYRYT